MSMRPPVISDINKLSVNFRKKFNPRRSEVIKKYPDAQIFETLRTQERQNRLYGVWRTHSLQRKPVTRTLTSNHKDWNAVDVIFGGKRAWPYDDLIAMGKKYGIKNLKPLETCHFEDDGTVYNPIFENSKLTIAIREYMALASKIYHLSESAVTKKRMEENNDYFRQFGY